MIRLHRTWSDESLSTLSKVVNIGRYRMLKDTNSGKILKTKSEVSALQDFISWLAGAKGDKEGVILICHEHERKVRVVSHVR